MVSHIKRRERHRTSITCITTRILLSRRRSIILKLDGLIRNVSGGCRHGITRVINFRFVSVDRTYCEKTDKDVVVVFIVQSVVVSICSTNPAALVTVSIVQGLVTSLTENVVSAAVMFEEGSTFVPDQLFTADP